jgi:hypothetical protein
MTDVESDFPWFRFYPEAAHDVKIDTIAEELEIDYLIVFGAWTRILCAASVSPVRGSLYVTDVKRYSNVTVTKMFRCSNELSIKLMSAFKESDMIDIDENGAYQVINWKKRQPVSDNSKERVRKHREKVKDETLQKRYSNGLDTEENTDTDKKKEHAPDGAAEEIVGKTDAIKKGNEVDMYVLGLSKQNDPISEYPAGVQEIIREFHKYFLVDIPRPKQRSKFAQWIKESNELNSACAEYGLSIIGELKKTCNYSVSHPGALCNTALSLVGRKRSDIIDYEEKRARGRD